MSAPWSCGGGQAPRPTPHTLEAAGPEGQHGPGRLKLQLRQARSDTQWRPEPEQAEHRTVGTAPCPPWPTRARRCRRAPRAPRAAARPRTPRAATHPPRPPRRPPRCAPPPAPRCTRLPCERVTGMVRERGGKGKALGLLWEVSAHAVGRHRAAPKALVRRCTHSTCHSGTRRSQGFRAPPAVAAAAAQERGRSAPRDAAARAH